MTGKFPYSRKPSLCGYCLRGGKGFFITIENKIYASCSYEHLEKIRERVNNKEDIKAVIEVNPESISKVLEDYKPTYLSLARKNNSFVFHEWTTEDKQFFFKKFVSLYLGLEDKNAREGIDG